MDQVTYDMIAGAAGALISLIFSFFPKVSEWFNPLQPNQKRGVMALALLLGVLVTFGLGCVGWLDDLFGVALQCTTVALVPLMRAWFIALIANQATFQITPK